MSLRSTCRALLLTVLPVYFTAANAATIAPGSAISFSTATDITGANPGTLLDFVQGLVSPGTFTATTRAAVYDRGNGELDFYYQVSNHDDSPNALGRLTMASFATVPVEVLFRTDAFGSFVTGQIAPSTADRGLSGAAIGVDFPACVTQGCSNPPAGKISPGQSSYTVVLRTNAVGYLAGTIGVIDGSAGTASGFQPVPLSGEEPVPEPVTLILTGLGLIWIGAKRLS